MTKQTLNLLESLINKMNCDNEMKIGGNYEMKPYKVSDDYYELTINYEMIYSSDMYWIMKFAMENDLRLMLGHYSNGEQAYMNIY